MQEGRKLMEWGGARDFNWSILDGRIIDVGYGTQWIVKSITENELELLWEDIEDNGEWYKIFCMLFLYEKYLDK